MSVIVQGILALLMSGWLFQEKPRVSALPDQGTAPTTEAAESGVEWKEGVTIPVRIPVASPAREFMTTIAFPEESIETAITGWGDGEITAVQKRGLLFLRLTKKSEGQLNVIGGSGTHYLLYLKGVENPAPDAYDAYLKIKRKNESKAADHLPKRQNHRPSGALELIQTMRLGLHPENVKILRAKRELVYESPSLEIRLVYVYDAQSYRGLIYEVINTSAERQSVDASRIRGKGTALVLTSLKDNVLLPKATTRLYAVTWKD